MWKPVFLPRSGKDLIWIVLYCNCGTLIWGLRNLGIFQGETGLFFLRHAKRIKKHAQRAAPTGVYFPWNGKFPKGKRIVTFCVVQKVTQKAHGTSSCDLGSKLYGILFSWYFRLSSLHRYVVRPAFKDVLNRCERVIAVQTQDRCFSKMGCHTASSQGQMYSKRETARYLCCGGNLFLRYADWNIELSQNFVVLHSPKAVVRFLKIWI